VKIDWKALTSFVTFILTIAGGFYKLSQDNQHMVIQQEQLSRTKQIRWQVDSLKLEYKMKEIQWDLQDSLRIHIARLKDELK
jgi:dihydroorotase|tara:strand:- start:445 stop:690 length:246 start_codon:yes stop_codon:yes gene_type:complete